MSTTLIRWQERLVTLLCLFCMAAPAHAQAPPTGVMVTAPGGAFAPEPAPVGTEVSATLSAKAQRPVPPPSSNSCTLSKPSWQWTDPEAFPPSGIMARYDESGEGSWIDANGMGFSYMIVSGANPPPDNDYDFSTVELSATFSIGANWMLMLSPKVNYTDTCGGKYEGRAYPVCTGTAFDVKRILRKPDGPGDYAPIEGDNAYALPGSLIDLQPELKPPGAKVTYKWDTPSGKPFKKYEADNSQATLHLLKASDLESKTLQFYWADTGEKSVKCKVTGGGVASKAATATLTIESPTVDVTAKQGVVRWYDDKKISFGLFGVEQFTDGMVFSGTVTIPAKYKPGTWQYVQTGLLNLFRTLKKDEQKQHWDQNNDLSVLDEAFPYRLNLQGKPAGPYPTGDKPGGAVDTPELGVQDTTEGDTIEASGGMKFDMYIMFKPSGSAQWVPLKFIPWWWSGTATFADDKYTLIDPKQGITLPAIATTTHPTWTKNMANGKFVND